MKKKKGHLFPLLIGALLFLTILSLFKFSSSLAIYTATKEKLENAEAEQARVEALIQSTRETVLKQTHTAGATDEEEVRRIVIREKETKKEQNEEEIFSGEENTVQVIPQN